MNTFRDRGFTAQEPLQSEYVKVLCSGGGGIIGHTGVADESSKKLYLSLGIQEYETYCAMIKQQNRMIRSSDKEIYRVTAVAFRFA